MSLLVRGKHVREVPEEYIDYILAEKFGWSIKQINETDQYIIDVLVKIISLENQEHKRINKYGK